jgi:hypothetical protein
VLEAAGAAAGETETGPQRHIRELLEHVECCSEGARIVAAVEEAVGQVLGTRHAGHIAAGEGERRSAGAGSRLEAQSAAARAVRRTREEGDRTVVVPVLAGEAAQSAAAAGRVAGLGSGYELGSKEGKRIERATWRSYITVS